MYVAGASIKYSYELVCDLCKYMLCQNVRERVERQSSTHGGQLYDVHSGKWHQRCLFVHICIVKLD